MHLLITFVFAQEESPFPFKEGSRPPWGSVLKRHLGAMSYSRNVLTMQAVTTMSCHNQQHDQQGGGQSNLGVFRSNDRENAARLTVPEDNIIAFHF